MFNRKMLCLGLSFLLLYSPSFGQDRVEIPDGELTLEQALDYSLKNSPLILKSQLNDQIGEFEIKSNLAGWFPQLNLSAGGAYNIKRQTQVIGDEMITFGQKYNSNVLAQVDQALFNKDLFFATKTSKFYREQLDQMLVNSKINTVVEVSKAYYDIILSEAQLEILDKNLIRLKKQYQDSYNRFEAGLVDKTDYQRAGIALTNMESDRNRVASTFKAKYAYLKQLMGYPEEAEFKIPTNVEQLENKIDLAQIEPLVLENRIEYQLQLTQQSLNEVNTSYEKWSYLPNLSGYYRYNWQFSNGAFSELFHRDYPTSSVGLSLGIPIFQGGKRVHRVKAAQLQEKRGMVELTDLGRQINTQYEQALANYKSSYFEWQTIRENMELAESIYDIIKLQYDEGVKAYVDLIIAETDLQTAQINHINALYEVLLSQLDLDKAAGLIKYN